MDWRSVEQDQARRRVVLPTYPFQRKRYVGFDKHNSSSFANKTAQTPLVNWLNQGDTAQLAHLLTDSNQFSPEQQALLPGLLDALIRQQQAQLALSTQNGATDKLALTIDDGVPAAGATTLG